MTPEKQKAWDSVQVGIEHDLDKFKVLFGYKDRSSFQLRVEDLEKQTVYCSIFDETKVTDKFTTAIVPFEVFLGVMREAIPAMNARMAELAENGREV